MTKKDFVLINPVIEGNDEVFSSNNSLDAAKKAYETLSKNFNGIVKKFNFSLLELEKNDKDNRSNKKNKLYDYDNKNFYHFSVYEKKNKDGEIEFSIKPIDDTIVLLDEFKKRAHLRLKKNNKNKLKQKGGKKSKYRDLEDDSSDSSDDYYVKKPKFNDFYTYNWWYNPLIYYTDTVYLPSVVAPYYTVFDFYPFTNIYNKTNQITFTKTI